MTDYHLKHPIFNCATDIAQIYSPLQKLNITYFGHIQINSSGKLAAMANNPEFADHYFKNKYYNADIHLSDKNLGQYVIWDTIERTKLSAKMHNEAAAFGMQHTFTIIHKNKNSTDYYHFANNSSDKSINQFYVTHIELLKSFIMHFNDKVQKNNVLKSAYHLTFSIDKNAEGYSLKNTEKAVISQNKISEFLNSI